MILEDSLTTWQQLGWFNSSQIHKTPLGLC